MEKLNTHFTLFQKVLLVFCLSLSITLIDAVSLSAQCTAAGGTITSNSDLGFCSGDGIEDIVNMSLSGNSGNSVWPITDYNGNILDIDAVPPFEFDDAGFGTCIIWHMSYTGNINGLVEGLNLYDVTGCWDLSNPVTVVRNDCTSCGSVNGGDISTNDDLRVCADDGNADMVNVSRSGTSGINQWVIADQFGSILAMPPAPPFNFEGAGGGACIIYNVAYQGSISGLSMGSNVFELSGCTDLSNPIVVVRTVGDDCDAGINMDMGNTCTASASTISTNDPLNVCADDGIDDLVNVSVTGGNGANAAWVITDDNLNILALPPNPPFNFEGAGNGTCLIWYLNFNGTITGATVGANAANLGGCFELSNSIAIVRNTNCSGGGDPFLTGNTGNEDCPSPWADSDGDGICDAADVCEGGDDFMDSDSDGIPDACDDNVSSCTVNGGTITTNDNLTVCADDGIDDFVDVSFSGGVGPNRGWIITDANRNILALPPSPPFNFEGAGAGNCLIYYFRHDGTLTGLTVGANVGNLGGCFDLSNSIEVVRTINCSGGGGPFLTGNTGNEDCPSPWVDSDGDGICDAADICEGGNDFMDSDSDGIPDACDDNNTGGGGDPFLTGNTGNEDCPSPWVDSDGDGICDAADICEGGDDFMDSDSDGIPDACDDNNNTGGGGGPVLTGNTGSEDCPSPWIDSDGDGVCDAADVCEGGDDFMDSNSNGIPDACDNSTVCTVNGGTISTNDNLTVCADDGIADLVNATVSGGSGLNATWVITDSDLNILALPPAPPFNFEGAGEGTCLIWYLSYTGPLLGAEVGKNAIHLMGCFDLSNPISVERNINCGSGGGPFLTGNTGNEDCPSPWLDTDNDGVCNAADICEGGDDFMDSDSDGIPNACDASNRVARVERLVAEAMQGREVQLTFAANEANEITLYTLEHSTDNENFSVVTDLMPINDGEIEVYYYEHKKTSIGDNFYRLRIDYADGTTEYYVDAPIYFEPTGISAFPNPAKEKLFVNLGELIDIPTEVKVFNALGVEIMSIDYDNAHNAIEEIALHKFNNGIYTLHINPEGFRPITQRVIVSKMY